MSKTTDGFVRLPNALIDHSDMDIYEMAVYTVLLRYRNPKTGKCWPGLSTIADGARCSRKTVIRTIAKLEDRGAIKVKRGARNESNVYEVALFDESNKKWSSASAKGTRRPQRNLTPETRARMSAAARTPRDSESPASDNEHAHSRELMSARDSESLPRDSQSLPLGTPSHPNKTNKKKIKEQAVRSDLAIPHELINFEPIEDRATDKQLSYIHDLYIHLTNYIPTTDLKERWTHLTTAEATERINTMLRQIPRYDAYEGPEYGTPEYNALTETGRQWAETGMLPDAA